MLKFVRPASSLSGLWLVAATAAAPFFLSGIATINAEVLKPTREIVFEDPPVPELDGVFPCRGPETRFSVMTTLLEIFGEENCSLVRDDNNDDDNDEESDEGGGILQVLKCYYRSSDYSASADYIHTPEVSRLMVSDLENPGGEVWTFGSPEFPSSSSNTVNLYHNSVDDDPIFDACFNDMTYLADIRSKLLYLSPAIQPAATEPLPCDHDGGESPWTILVTLYDIFGKWGCSSNTDTTQPEADGSESVACWTRVLGGPTILAEFHYDTAETAYLVTIGNGDNYETYENDGRYFRYDRNTAVEGACLNDMSILREAYTNLRGYTTPSPTGAPSVSLYPSGSPTGSPTGAPTGTPTLGCLDALHDDIETFFLDTFRESNCDHPYPGELRCDLFFDDGYTVFGTYGFTRERDPKPIKMSIVSVSPDNNFEADFTTGLIQEGTYSSYNDMNCDFPDIYFLHIDDIFRISDLVSDSPSDSPSDSYVPTASMVPSGSMYPSDVPSEPETEFPSGSPSGSPVNNPSSAPSNAPSDTPTGSPSGSPVNNPSSAPSNAPSDTPTGSPIVNPTIPPSNPPTGARTCMNNPFPFRRGNGDTAYCLDIASLSSGRNTQCTSVYKENCPGLCKTSCACHDYEFEFLAKPGASNQITCSGVAALSEAEQKKKCNFKTVAKNCPSVCDDDCSGI